MVLLFRLCFYTILTKAYAVLTLGMEWSDGPLKVDLLGHFIRGNKLPFPLSTRKVRVEMDLFKYSSVCVEEWLRGMYGRTLVKVRRSLGEGGDRALDEGNGHDS